MAHVSAAPLRRPATPLRRPARSALAFVPALLAVAAWLLLPAAASAEPPSRLPQPITDTAGVLDDADIARIQEATNTLYDEHGLQLWVTYVSSFDGRDYDSWAQATAQASNFGPDTALLAVATDDREFALWTPTGSEISESERDRISSSDVVPALRNSDWAGAAVGAADGLSNALAPSAAPVTTLLVGGGVIAAGGAGVYAYNRRSKKKRAEAGAAQAAQIDPADTTALRGLPIEGLDQYAQTLLVDTDNAVRSSAEALELARGEFGDSAVAPFDRAHRQAQVALANAFEIRQRLDDDIPETPEQQRDMLVQLVSSCGQANRELDAQVEAFDKMRNLLLDAPARLDGLTQRAIALTARIPEAERTLGQLHSEFPAGALTPVVDNVSLAQEEISFAENAIDQGRTAVARPVGEQGDAVRAIREAERALGHAATLLDALDHAAEDIRRAIATLPAAMEDAEQGVADAKKLVDAGGPEFVDAMKAVQDALEHARAEQHTDPLGSFTRVVEADARLDELRARTRAAKQQAEEMRRRLEQDLNAAQAQVTAAADFIGTRRGVVGAQARTRLSEAQRHLQAAQQAAESDPAAAVQYARSAASLAAQALRSAQNDVQRWNNQHRPPRGGSSGGNVAGAVLGGILINSVLNSGRGGGGFGGGGFGGGGFGGGGFGGGGFGGSSGGRF
ncbi:TPM domain-containing protein [Rhodococcus rhodochrous]|uniref:TPM domain-containing protein n=1 Tax=Rhodococcus rhodochrous TaxID=1829 RepID=A0AA47A8J2_RHORH|nr:TPM domain-containing protein [Rhodococcus rhodochrous]MBF4477155.1 TPM domain-containing protein [Rhodococcus rhodochrous]MCB8909057.1 TPM domain-containing protein [Rhodococcus rhodochrous]UZF43430.1 TPM domain-containing protein [Rhodococcus rhodochrous]